MERPPEDLVEPLLVVLLPLLDLDGLDDFVSLLAPLSREELFLVLLLLDFPLSLFPESLVERADVPERVELFLFAEEDLLRLLLESPAFVSLLELRARTRLSSSDPTFSLPVPRWVVDLVDLRKNSLVPFSTFRVPSFVLVERLFAWFVILALRDAP